MESFWLKSSKSKSFPLNFLVIQLELQKHHGIIFDAQGDFKSYLKSTRNNVIKKTISPLRQLQGLFVIYKSFVRLILDYGDFIYDQTYSDSFYQKLESVQYNVGYSYIWSHQGYVLKTLTRI